MTRRARVKPTHRIVRREIAVCRAATFSGRRLPDVVRIKSTLECGHVRVEHVAADRLEHRLKRMAGKLACYECERASRPYFGAVDGQRKADA